MLYSQKRKKNMISIQLLVKKVQKQVAIIKNLKFEIQVGIKNAPLKSTETSENCA